MSALCGVTVYYDDPRSKVARIVIETPEEHERHWDEFIEQGGVHYQVFAWYFHEHRFPTYSDDPVEEALIYRDKLVQQAVDLGWKIYTTWD